MAMTITPHDDTEFETSGRRRKITKFALAGVAVLGVGAALTSAAWSDNVWFGGSTDSADFQLSGATSNTPQSVWYGDSTSTATIPLPSTAFDEIAPGIEDSYDVFVRNDGDIPVYLSDAVVDVTGDMEGFVTTSASYDVAILAPGAIATVTVGVTGTSALDENVTGQISIHVQGSSEAPTP